MSQHLTIPRSVALLQQKLHQPLDEQHYTTATAIWVSQSLEHNQILHSLARNGQVVRKQCLNISLVRVYSCRHTY